MRISMRAGTHSRWQSLLQLAGLRALIVAATVTLTAWSTQSAAATPPYRNAAEALAAFETHALETLIPADKQGWQVLDADDAYHGCSDGALLASGAIERDGKLALISLQTGEDIYPGESFSQGTEALAAAFDRFSVNALDMLLPGGRTWKIVRGENGLLPEIDAESVTMLEGSITAEGKILLTSEQQQRARELLRRHPDELGIVFAGYLFQFRLSESPGGVEVALPAYDDRERIRRLRARWKPYRSVQEALTGFAIAPHADLSVYPEILPEEWQNWRLLHHKHREGHRAHAELIASGKLVDNQLSLTPEQGKKLWQAWERHPEEIWLQAGTLSFRLSARQMPDGRYVIDLLDHSGMDPRGRQIRHLEGRQKIDPAFYTQAGYPASKYRQEFNEWKQRFEADLDELRRALGSGTVLPWRDLKAGASQLDALDAKQRQALATLFAGSIDDGPKELMLRLLIIEAFFSRDRRVFPAGTTAVKLLTHPQTQPVGYGGVFKDGANPVELWYIVLDNPQEWTLAELEESRIYRRFQPMTLPGYGETVRNRWPALTFNRDANGRLRLYAISAELATIIRAIFDAQTS